jgi:large subunit ribosomal protein L18
MADPNKLKNLNRLRKRKRIRKHISGTAEKPRLFVYRSARNIYAQLIDDAKNRTLAGVSTLSPDVRKDEEKAGSRVEAANVVGKGIAEKAKNLKIKQVVFDRGGYQYHGRVRAVAEGARENGLEF